MESTIEVGAEYEYEDVTAIDDVDGIVEVTTFGEVDTSVPGIYEITYTVEDSAGNTATLKKTVTIINSEL